MERKVIEFQPESYYLLKSLVEIGNAPLDEMAANYSQTWANSGINVSSLEARRKISSFNPKGSYILLEPNTHELLGQIHVVPVFAASLKEFIRQFRTYKKVEEAACSEAQINPNFIICFSLNCKPGYYIKNGQEAVPLPKFILKHLPIPDSAYKIGFSFINMEGPEEAGADSMLSRYKELVALDNTRSGGPAMMHEAFGGIVVAFLPNARPEHKAAGGGITLVVYPRNDRQIELFARIKVKRREGGPIPFERFDNTIILKDVQLLTPLRR